MTNRTIDSNALERACNDLEAVHDLIHDLLADAPSGGEDLQERHRFENRLWYLVDRLGEHVVALRRVIEGEAAS
jgi:hypothetical protein